MADSRDLENKKEGLGTVDFWASLFQVTPEQFEDAVGDNSKTVPSGGGDAVLKEQIFPDSNNDQQNGGNVINNPQDLGKQVGLETGTQAAPIDMAMAANLKINSREVIGMKKENSELSVEDVPLVQDIFKEQIKGSRSGEMESKLKERIIAIISNNKNCKFLYKDIVKDAPTEAQKLVDDLANDMYRMYGINHLSRANRSLWSKDGKIDDESRKELKPFESYIPSLAKDPLSQLSESLSLETSEPLPETPEGVAEPVAPADLQEEIPAPLEKKESINEYYDDIGKFYFGELKSGDNFRFEDDSNIYAVTNVDKSKQIVATQSGEDNFVFSLDELNEQVIHKLRKLIAKEEGYKLFEKVKFVDENDEETKGKIGYVIHINKDVPERVQYVVAWGIESDPETISADKISSLPGDMLVAIDGALTEEEEKKVKEVSEEYAKIISNPEGKDECCEEEVELEACGDTMASYASYIKSSVDISDIKNSLAEELAEGEEQDINAVIEGYIPDVFSQLTATDKMYNKHLYVSAIRAVLKEAAGLDKKKGNK